MIHTDLWGPAPIPSTKGHRYYIFFVDDKTRYTWLFPITTKYQALDIFIIFKKTNRKPTECKDQNTTNRHGGEFRIFELYLKKEVIILRHSYPYPYEQNGKIERKHRHIVETGLTLLAQAKMPLKYWQKAFTHTVFIINRLVSLVTRNKTPFELMYSLKLDYSQVKVFGCECFPHLRPYNKRKFDFHTSK